MNRKMNHEKNFEMREIKFRAKDRVGVWVDGDLRLTSREPHIWTDPYTSHIINTETIGQYTGLEDKNGKEIYEGDILRIEEFRNESGPIEKSEEFYEVFDLEDMKGEKQREYTTPVSWEDGAFVMSFLQENDTYLGVLFGDMRLSFPIFIFEVIGNIHDNPELVKG